MIFRFFALPHTRSTIFTARVIFLRGNTFSASFLSSSCHPALLRPTLFKSRPSRLMILLSPKVSPAGLVDRGCPLVLLGRAGAVVQFIPRFKRRSDWLKVIIKLNKTAFRTADLLIFFSQNMHPSGSKFALCIFD